MKIGVLTSGGDAPGMNAAVRAVVKAANYHNIEVMGIKYGFQGILDEQFDTIHPHDLDHVTNKGGTILKTSRSPEFMTEAGRIKAVNILAKHGIIAVVVIGGDGSFKGAEKLHQLGVKVVGIPCTIDNDFSYSDYSIGFDTTLNTVLDCIGKIKDTDYSHDKTTIVEVMGRYCGDLALYSALAGGGEIISTPERKLSLDEICTQLQSKINSGKKDNLVIITERMYHIDELQSYIEEKLQVNVRTTVLGFIQRGGNPSAYDRILASKMGVSAVELLVNGQTGLAIGIQNNQMITKELEKVNADIRVNDEHYQFLEALLV